MFLNGSVRVQAASGVLDDGGDDELRSIFFLGLSLQDLPLACAFCRHSLITTAALTVKGEGFVSRFPAEILQRFP